ncbi:MAG: hypothetical protein WCP82_11640 [Alphaproteobacteria bacterium]
MLVFFWVLASMGVAYWAKIHDRNTALWFVVAVLLSPPVGAIALAVLDRQRR